jgi:uncharacterized protein YuzE
VRSGRYSFPYVTYDPPSDVLYAQLSLGAAARRERTQEGDIWTYDDRDRPTGVIVMEPRARLRRDGAVYITLPGGSRERLQGVEAELRG